MSNYVELFDSGEVARDPGRYFETVSSQFPSSGIPGLYVVTDYGALGNNTGDDGPAINEAISDASAGGGGVVLFPAGTYRITTALVDATGKSIALVGYGAGVVAGNSNAPVSILKFPTDLGDDVCAFNTNGWHNSIIQGLKFQGPNEAPSFGTQTMNMTGIRCQAGVVLRDVCVTGGFLAGIEILGDHAYFDYVKSGNGNYYGLYYPGRHVQSHGDNHFVHCNFSSAAMASVGVHGNNECAGDLFDGTHFGFCPYGAYKETAGTDINFIANSHFVRSSFEACGNAAIYDSTATGVVKGNVWDHCGFTYDGTYQYLGDGGKKRGWIDVSNLTSNTFMMGNLGFLPQYSPGTTSHVYTSVSCTGNRFTLSSYSGNSKPFFGGTLVSPLQNEVLEEGFRLRYRPYWIAATVAAGDCVEIVRVDASTIGVQKAVDGSGKPLAGMVVESAVPGAGGVGWILNEGRYSAAGGPIVEGSVSAGDLLTPDGCSTAGKVKTVANATDRVFGVAAGDVADGNRCTPVVNLGGKMGF